MATRLDNQPNTTGTRPVVWPWIVLAVVVVLALWWAAMNGGNMKSNTSYSTPNTSTAPGSGNTTSGATP